MESRNQEEVVIKEGIVESVSVYPRKAAPLLSRTYTHMYSTLTQYPKGKEDITFWSLTDHNPLSPFGQKFVLKQQLLTNE